MRKPGVWLILWLALNAHAAEPAPTTAPATTTPASTAPATTSPNSQANINRPSPAEQEIAATRQLAQQPRAGESRWLDSPHGRYLALILPATTGEVRGTFILLPRRGDNPDDPRLLHTLRTALPALGWTTWSLSLQAVPAEGGSAADSPDSLVEALNAALTEVEKTAPKARFILAHGDTALALLSKRQTLARYDGLVLLQARAPDPAATEALHASLALLDKPVLDVIAQRRDESDAIAQRQSAGKRSAKGDYQLLRLVGTDDYLTGHTGFLAHGIAGWAMRRRPPPDAATAKP